MHERIRALEKNQRFSAFFLLCFAGSALIMTLMVVLLYNKKKLKKKKCDSEFGVGCYGGYV